MKLKVGIFFGGPSREREQSYLSGRTVFEYLDRALFDPVPVFVDHDRRFVRLEWPLLQREGIRDFYPAMELLPPSPHGFRIYADSLGELPEEDRERLFERIGRPLTADELPQLIDLAFLALPGPFGSDGELQALLSARGIPCTGSGADTCRTLADHARRQQRLVDAGLNTPAYQLLEREQWVKSEASVAVSLRFPIRVLPARHPMMQDGTLIETPADTEAFADAVNKAFFREVIPVEDWRRRSLFDRVDHLQLLTDLEDSLGFPLDVRTSDAIVTVYHPEQLLQYLDEQAARREPAEAFILERREPARQVLLEEVPAGQVFSCLVVETDSGQALALLPAGSGRGAGTGEVFHPLDLPAELLGAARQACEQAFSALRCRGLARIDGLIAADGKVWIRQVQPTPAYTPLSFVFQQLALLGLSPSRSLTFLLHQSLRGQAPEPSEHRLATALEEQLARRSSLAPGRQKVALLFGGAADERQRSLAAARNVFGKLAGSETYDPVALFLAGGEPGGPLYQLPMSLLLEPTATGLERRLAAWHSSETEEDIVAEGRSLTRRYGAPDLVLSPQRLGLADLVEWVDSVFLAVAGPPAEDGRLQAELERLDLPYSGAEAAACVSTFNQHHALEVLGKNGVPIPRLLSLTKKQYHDDPEACFDRIETQLRYPLYARPAETYSAIARRPLNNREELQAYTRLLFRPEGHEGLESRYVLRIRPRETFPRREAILFEGQEGAGGATRFLSVTAGLYTTFDEKDRVQYHLLPPSELLAAGEPLTLEEQYQVSGGRYLTPARFSPSPEDSSEMAGQVQETMERAARILNLQGYAQIDGLVRVFADGRAETVITGIQTQPPLTPDNPLFRQAVADGISPKELLTSFIEFARKRRLQPAKPVEPPPAAQEPAWVGTIVEKPAAFPPEPPSLPEEPELRPYRSTNSRFTMTIWDHLKHFFHNIWAFISSPFFLKNLVLLAGLGVMLLLLTNWILRLYTHHGESLEVHNYIGMQLKDAEKTARSRSFQIVISDSIFRVDQPPNTVLEQHPAPFSRVKEDRRIYLTVTSSTAPQVSLPPLEGAYNYEAYRRKLLRLGIESTIRERQYDNKLEENTILHLYYDGRKITEDDLRRGVKVPKGSTVEFVVTERLTDQVPAPDLICKRYEEASFLITATNLVIGEVYGDLENRDQAFIYQQDPEPGVMMRMGEQINIYLSSRRPRDCPEVEMPSIEQEEESIEEDPFGTGE